MTDTTPCPDCHHTFAMTRDRCPHCGRPARFPNVAMADDARERQALWRKWWKAVSEKGEEEALAELAAVGDHTSELAAKRLLAKWPTRSRKVIEGARKATNRWVRKRLIELVAEVKTDEVAAFLTQSKLKNATT